MPNDPQYLTPEKFAELKTELEFLKTDRRKEVADQLEYAKKLGDLSENAEYHQVREEQGLVEARIGHIEAILKEAIILQKDAAGVDIVTVGSTVSLVRDGESKSYTYVIVGSEEADMAQGKVSNMSPLGSALLGHKPGDKIKVQTPKGVSAYTLNSIK